MSTARTIYASLISTDGKESIEIDNLWGETEVKRLMEAGTLVHGQIYARGDRKFRFVCYDTLEEWARR